MFPYWLERQVDPKSPDFRPITRAGPEGLFPGDLGGEPVNDTCRVWTLVGNLHSWRRALVDPRGLVTPVDGGWSLDWWIRADDRWHLPSREVAVRQFLVEDAPVVETRMRVAGGDVVHRAYAVRLGHREVAAVELENSTAVPIAVALAIRPFNPTGLASIASISLDESRTSASVDGFEVLMFGKAPSQLIGSTGAGGDCVGEVVAERTELPDRWHDISCPRGLAQAAFVFPLAHTAVLRVAMPLEPATEARSAAAAIRRVVARPSPSPVEGTREGASRDLVASVPESSRVASGWVTQRGRGVRLELPDGRLAQAVSAARCHLLLVHGGEDIATVPTASLDFTEAAAILGALDVFGYADEAEQLLGTWPERQRSDGWFGAEDRWDANGAALHALSEHRRRVGFPDADDELALLVARAAHAIDKKHSQGRHRRRSGPEATIGLLPPGSGPRAGGPPGRWVRDAVWSSQGLHDAAALLGAMGQAEASADVARVASRFESDLRGALDAIPGGVWPSTIERGADAGIVANLDAINLPRSLLVGLPGLGQTVEAIRHRLAGTGAVHHAHGPAGLSPRYTAMLGRAELNLDTQPHEGSQARLGWLLSHASPTWAWPEAQHPTRGGGTLGAGQDSVATGWFLRLARDMVVRETADGGVAMCTAWPESWLGQDLEVHEAPTAAGTVSFAIRWHGERPAVLWEVARSYDLSREVRMTVPGLDLSWSSIDPQGEALLKPPTIASRRVDVAGDGLG